MDTILYFFDRLNFSEQNGILLMVLLTSVTIVVTVFLIISGSRHSIKKRMDLISVESLGLSDKSKVPNSVSNRIDSLFPILTPANAEERESIRLKLTRAGFHLEKSVSYFYAIKFSSMLASLMVVYIYYILSGSDTNLIALIFFGAGFGMFVPNLILNHLMKKRKLRIKRGVPDALDLLVVCTESGLGLNMAIKRVAQELAISHSELADELDTVCLKIKAGYEMPHAFKDMVERTGIFELNGLVSMLSHASRVGGSLSQTLRDYTEDYRDKRTQEVEEIAAKIPTKMIFPMLMCIWPSFFIVVVGPAALGIIDTFSKLMQ